MSASVASLLAAAAAKAPKAPAPAQRPAKPEQPAIQWDSIDPATLPEDVRELFFAIGRARSAFESHMASLLEPPAHLKLVFAYKRGLAIGLTEARAKTNALAALMARISAAE